MPDILIRGMEMPENDSIIVAIRSDGKIEDVMGCYIGTAVELQPHGDLIDRGAILNAEKTKPIAKMMMFGGAYVIDLDVVRDAPVVIPAERRDE